MSDSPPKNHRRRSSNNKLDDFPDDLDETYFHNEIVDQSQRIRELRFLVNDKIQTTVSSVIGKYNEHDIPLADTVSVEILNTEGRRRYSTFEWAVVREELQERSIKSTIKMEGGKVVSLVVDITRSITVDSVKQETVSE